MSAAAPVKFRFDLDLGRRAEPGPALSESAVAMLLAEARAQGRHEGIEEGRRLAAEDAALRLAGAAEQMADQVAALAATLDDSSRQMRIEAVALAAAVGRKLAHHLLNSQPVAEIEALLAECLATLDEVPHLVIRCAPELADAVRDVAGARIANSGFTGRLVVLGDPEIGLGDARIEWADGGIVRDRAALDASIDNRIATYLAGRAGASGDPTP
jgi:flagellar assembly protein FliH